MTIVGGILVGLSARRAAEFSFLLGLITLSAATGWVVFTRRAVLFAVLDWQPVLFGCFVALVSAVISVRWLVSYLTRHGLTAFAYYRVFLAIGVLFFLAI